MPDGAEPAPALRRHREGAVETLTLSRPAARNALSLALLRALRDALAEVARDEGVRCLLLAAEGPAFCAGHDLREMREALDDGAAGRARLAETLALCAEVMQALPALPQPVVAAVQGVATAAGCQLAAACDLVVAAEDARFATPGVEIGLFCSTPAVALSRAVPERAALAMLLTGEPVDAEEARRLGLVHRLAPPARLREEAARLAERVAARPAAAVRIGKRAFHAQRGRPLDEAYRVATAAMLENLGAEDAREGIGAFLDKRRPGWTHR